KGKYGDGPKEQCGICWNRGHAAADCWYKGKGKGGTKGKVHEFSAEPDAPSLASLAAPASSVGTSASVTARNVSCISAAKSSTINSLTRVTTELRPQPRYVMMIRGEATADTSAAQPLVAGSPAPAPSYLNSMDDERDELTVQDALPVKPKVCGIGARPDLRGRLLIDSGACESVVRPHVFEQYVDPTKACKLYAVNDSEIHVDGSQAALMKFRTAAGNSELGQVNFSVTSYTMEDILSVCKQMEAGYDVHFCRTGCFIDNDAGDKLLFYREGDRFYLDFEHLSDAELEQHHETRLMAPISSDNSIAMRLAEEAEPADDGWNHMEPFDQEAEEAHEEFDAGALDDEMTLEELRAQVALPQEPQGIKVPQEPTPAERERRNLLHLDMAPWCETCVAAKGREAHHVRDKDPGDPITPLVQIDYMFMSRDGTLVEDESRLVTMLTGIAASSGWLLAVMVPQKGTGGGKDYAVRALELFLTGLGEPLIMLQYDGENPIRVLAQAVQKRLGSDKIHHQSLGACEGNGGWLAGHIRAWLADVQARYPTESIDVNHNIFPWLVRRVGWLIARFHVKHGLTPYRCVKDRDYQSPICIFAETVLAKIPDMNSLAKSKARWIKCIWLGRAEADNSHILTASDGIVSARTVRRLPVASQCDAATPHEACGLPWAPKDGVRKPVAAERSDQVVFQVPVPPPLDPAAGGPAQDNNTCDSCSDSSSSSESGEPVEGRVPGQATLQNNDDGMGLAPASGSPEPAAVAGRPAPLPPAIVFPTGLGGGRLPPVRDAMQDDPKRSRLAMIADGLWTAVGNLASAEVDDLELRKVLGSITELMDTVLNPALTLEARQTQLATLAARSLYTPVLRTSITRSDTVFAHKWVDKCSKGLRKSRLTCADIKAKYTSEENDELDVHSSTPLPESHGLLEVKALLHYWPTMTADVIAAFLIGLDCGDAYGSPRLDGNLYGRRTAGAVYRHALEEILTHRLKDQGYAFVRGQKDPTTYSCQVTQIWLLHRIDDFRAAGPPEALLKLFRDEGDLESLETMVEVLGRRKLRSEGMIATIPDNKHCESILCVLSLEGKDAKAHGLPSRPRDKTGTGADELSPEQASKYREATGSAIYLSLDRRDLQFAVKELARHMAAPLQCDWQALKQLGRYLLSGEMARVTLVSDDDRADYNSGRGLSLVAYSDSDWAGCPENRSSTDCVCINIGSSVLKVGCQTQPGLPATSYSDAELRGMSRAARELYFVAQLATIDFAIPVQTPSLFADSSVGLAISRKLGPGNKLRHLEVCYVLVQEMVRRKLIKTYKCKGTANPANFLTKHAASPAAVQEALPALGMISLNEVSLQAALRDARLVKVSAFRKLITPWKPRRAAAATALQLSCISATLSKAAAATNDDEGDDSFWLYVFTALAVGLTYFFWNVSRTQQTDSCQQTAPQRGAPDELEVIDLLQLSRLRTAWRVARATLNKTEQRRIAGQGAEDMDEPLDASTQDSLLKQFAATYSQNLAAWLHPADSLLGRIYREFQRNTPTVISIKKVKSLPIASRPSSEREVNLGGNVKLHLSDGVADGLSIASCVDYYWGLRILGYAHSIVGQYKASSMQTPGAQVVYAPLSVNMDYADLCLKRSQVWQGAEPLSWLRTKDEATRGRQVELMRMGWPQGEALQKALTEMDLQWRVGPVPSQTKRIANESVGGGHEEEGESPAKNVRTAVTFQSQELCKKWNDQRGCPGEKECGKSHRCDVIKADGNTCGSKSRNRCVGLASSSSSGNVGQKKKAMADAKSSKAGGLSSEPRVVLLPAGVSNLSTDISALKPTQWCGKHALPQIPWTLGVGVPILVISLCGGVGGLPIGLLAMGATIYTVAILSDDCARETSVRYLKNVVHVKDAETMTGPLLRGFLRVFPDGCPILVGGTCPWSGREDMRPTVFSEVPRIACEIEAEIVALKKANQVLKFAENTWATDNDFKEKATEYFQGSPVRTQAGEFGYVRRDRAWWGVGTKGNMATIEAKMPVGVTLVEEKGIVRLVWQGKKPMPERFQAEGHFDLFFKPEDVMKASGRRAMATMSQEFCHPAVNLEKLTQEALRRFDADGRRFPALSYEPQSLMWSKLPTWRPPCPTERASLMMLPHDVVTSVSVDKGEEAPQREARQNSLVGNSFHIPSLMMVLILLFQTIQAIGNQLPEPTWAHFEPDLRQAVRGTVWQPGLVESWPKLIEPTALVASMHELFLSQGLKLDHAVQSHNVPVKAITLLQSYWVDTQMRALPSENQGIDWSMQRNKHATAMGLGSQRGGPHCAGASPALIERGVGKDAHMAFAMPLPSPFDSENVMDDDALYAARAMARLGPYIRIWRRRMLRALEALAKAFQPWDDLLVSLMLPDVQAVARTKKPAMMACLVVLLRWPDRTLPARYVLGFRLVGIIENSHLFKQLDKDVTVESGKQTLLGTHAVKAIEGLPEKLRRGRFLLEIKESVLKEVAEGGAKGVYAENDLNDMFGVGGWLPLDRFMHQQSCGKMRPIDNGKTYGHNKASLETETIYASGPDFIAASAKAFLTEVLVVLELQGHTPKGVLACEDLTKLCSFLPEWSGLDTDTDDMKDAYRQCPNEPEDHCVVVIAFWDEEDSTVKYIILRGMPFGFSSAVLNFNRTPALATAAARRMTGAMAASFFDDTGIFDSKAGVGSAQASVGTVYTCIGADLAPAKQQPMAAQRVFLGLLADVGRAHTSGFMYFDVKPFGRQELATDIDNIIAEGQCSSGQASKLRGRFRWAATAAYGKCGCGGQASLVQRTIRLLGPPLAAIKIYSDVSFEPPMKAKLGNVIFMNDGSRPIGRTAVIPELLMEQFVARKTQITPFEAFCGVVVPFNHLELLRGRDVVWFIDNTAALSILIKGASSLHDLNSIATVMHLLMAKVGCRIWFEWIDSDSNPSDGLSRDGLEDEWTKGQGWDLGIAILPDWQKLAESSFLEMSQVFQRPVNPQVSVGK
ncbi:unnamed protein product, partial [Polarella glacialis]